MEAIKALLNELRRCEIINDYKVNFSYNGITLEESSVAFQRRLHRLYEDALVDIPLLAQESKDVFGDIIERYAESQQLFDVPDESVLESMNREIELGNTNTNLRQERDFVKMICECVSLQKYYLNEFAAAIDYTSTEQVVTATDETPVEETSIGNDNIISGVRGLATRLSCSIATAQKIVNCGILKQRGIQYMVADNWKFDNKKLTKLLQEEPEILGLRTKK